MKRSKILVIATLICFSSVIVAVAPAHADNWHKLVCTQIQGDGDITGMDDHSMHLTLNLTKMLVWSSFGTRSEMTATDTTLKWDVKSGGDLLDQYVLDRSTLQLTGARGWIDQCEEDVPQL
ncbi:MAG TPA: hypothetical protein VMH86_10955 [Rhizomicrobium sp.]|nr:hypothetical protein [Rhizomicrobium sp.]